MPGHGVVRSHAVSPPGPPGRRHGAVSPPVVLLPWAPCPTPTARDTTHARLRRQRTGPRAGPVSRTASKAGSTPFPRVPGPDVCRAAWPAGGHRDDRNDVQTTLVFAGFASHRGVSKSHTIQPGAQPRGAVLSDHYDTDEGQRPLPSRTPQPGLASRGPCHLGAADAGQVEGVLRGAPDSLTNVSSAPMWDLSWGGQTDRVPGLQGAGQGPPAHVAPGAQEWCGHVDRPGLPPPRL